MKSLLSLGLLLGALALPIFTSGAQTVTRIAAGAAHSLFLKSDGSLWGMGANGSGQLGDGAAANPYGGSTNRPEQIVSSNVTAIAAHYYHSLFLKSDGSLWAMGDNNFGGSGDGTYNNTNRPEQIVASNVTAIAAGWYYSLFLKRDGSLWAMGDNSRGELGDGTYNNTNRPEQVVASNVTAIAAGEFHSLFLKSDGSLWAMGGNADGQLGDGTVNNTNRPEQIVASNVVAIAAGDKHSLFLKSDGSLWGMGANGYGQLGGYNTPNLPGQIVVSGVTAIAGAATHSLFLKSDGSLWGMGNNGAGQLGNAIYTYSTGRPERIASSNVTAIAAGGGESLFLKTDGSLWGMGNNGSGQLGLGTDTITKTTIPAQLVPLAIPLLFYNIVAEGGFETEDFYFWDLSGNVSPDTLVSPIKSGYVHSGGYGVQSGPVGAPIYISQTLNTTPGVTYLLSFWLTNPDGETPNEFLVSWNGATLLDKTNLAAFGWTNLQFTVTATGTSTVLQFGIRDDNAYLGLDDIGVVPMVQTGSTGISSSGTNLVMVTHGSNGLYGLAYHTLMSTNLAQPLNQWTPIATNVLGADGNFTLAVTNAVNPAVRQRFYTLQLQ